ncbi:MAG: sulfotransferase [Chloroflexota bacterium]
MTDFVFIVGLPRTGTKLLMNVLENSPNRACHITPENFFLGRFMRPGIRNQMHKLGDFSDDARVSQLVDQIFQGHYSVFKGDYWWLAAQGELRLDAATVKKMILESDRSDKALYQILLQAYAGSDENVILGDKTGPHLYHMSTLMEWFPHAKVVHTFRDPRAILASEHKKQLAKLDRQVTKAQNKGNHLQAFGLKMRKPFSSLLTVFYVTIAWLAAARLDKQYKEKYPDNYYLSSFESLVQNPEDSIKAICSFLDIEFQEAMLNPPKVDSSFSPKGGSGFNTQTLNRWETYLKPWMKAWVVFWNRKYLKAFDYIH